MKNYTYGWVLKDRGYTEISESDYSDSQKEMKEYIELLSNAINKAQCGWDEVKYKVMQTKWESREVYMVLCVGGHEERWIPITGNSKGCNLQVLGENIW